MKDIDPKYFHKLYGVRKTRITYQKKDFFDYTFMTLITAAVIYLVYGKDHWLSVMGVGLCVFMIVSFLIRHGFGLGMPVILKRPQDILYMVVYKIQNIKPMYLIAISVLLLENYFIALTPNWPHNTELMRKIAMYLFYIHFLSISAYRTVILIAHLHKRDLVREVLMQSFWKSFISRQPSIVWEILHAYFTGILAHIVLIAPWYMIITYADFSVLFLLMVCVVNVMTQVKFFKALNAWFYRDHWLGHNSEFEFLYLHGTHHDAIPSGLIGVAGNGHLEGFTRHIMGSPAPFYNPVIAFMVYTFEVKSDIDAHQYIPGIFPKLSKQLQEASQHSTHHFGRLEPYSFGLKVDQPEVSKQTKRELKMFPEEIKNSIILDEQLTGFKWDNPRHRWFVDLYNKYHK